MYSMPRLVFAGDSV